MICLPRRAPRLWLLGLATCALLTPGCAHQREVVYPSHARAAAPRPIRTGQVPYLRNPLRSLWQQAKDAGRPAVPKPGTRG